MKKYTVVYSEFSQSGSHSYSIVHFTRIKCQPKKIESVLNKNNIEMSQVNYIFEGHSKMEGER